MIEGKKKKKKLVQEPAAAEPVKKKKKKKKLGTAEPAAAEPAKKKKAKESTGAASTQLFRPGSMVGQLYDRMKDGKKITMEKLFAGLDCGDQHRLLTDLRNRGKKTEEFKIVRVEPGVLKLVEWDAAE